MKKLLLLSVLCITFIGTMSIFNTAQAKTTVVIRPVVAKVTIVMTNGIRVTFDWNKYWYVGNYNAAHNVWCRWYRRQPKNSGCTLWAAWNNSRYVFDRAAITDPFKFFRNAGGYVGGTGYGDGWVINSNPPWARSVWTRRQGVTIVRDHQRGRVRLVIGFQSTSWVRFYSRSSPMNILKALVRKKVKLLGTNAHLNQLWWNGRIIYQ